MKTKLIFLTLIIFFFKDCQTYLINDNSSEYILTEQKKTCFQNQKIELLGFNVLLDYDPKPVDFYNFEKKITNKDHLTLIRFVNSGDRDILPENKNSFVKIWQTRSNRIRISDKILDESLSSKKHFPETKKIPTIKGIKLKEKDLKEFLSKFLNEYKHFGLEEVSKLLEFENNQINLKSSTTDFYIIGIHEHESKPYPLTTLFTILTLGIIPDYSEEIIKSSYYLYNSSLKQIHFYNSENSFSSYTGLWIIGDGPTENENKNHFLSTGLKNSINQFSKELAEKICK